MKNLQEVLFLFLEQLQETEIPNDRNEYAASLYNTLGAVYYILAEIGISPAENLQQALAVYNEAAEIFRRNGLEKELSYTLNNQGIAYSTLASMSIDAAENLQQALAVYNEAAEIFRRNGLEKELSYTLNNQGIAYSTLASMSIDAAENLQQALAVLNEAAEIYRRNGLEKELSDTLNNLGAAYRTQAEMGINAAENLQQALAVLNEAAEIRLRLGLEKELSDTLNNLGNALCTQAKMRISPFNNLQQALAAYNEAAEITRRLGLARDLARTLNNFGFAYQAQSRLPEISDSEKQAALENAYQNFKDALEKVEYLRGEIGVGIIEDYKRKFSEEWNRVYLGMVKVCLELGKYEDALVYAERSKARNLLVELMAIRDVYPESIPENIRKRLKKLKIAIFQEEYRLQKEEKPDYTRLNQLREEKQQLEPYKPLNFQEIQELLDEETAILEWYILWDKFLTFTLTRHNLYLWISSKEDKKKLFKWANAYLNDYYQENKTSWQDSLPQRLEELSQILHLDEILQNLRQNLPNCQRLILIPHRFLHLFPLHALPVNLPSSPNLLLSENEEGADTLSSSSSSSPLSENEEGADTLSSSSSSSPLSENEEGADTLSSSSSSSPLSENEEGADTLSSSSSSSPLSENEEGADTLSSSSSSFPLLENEEGAGVDGITLQELFPKGVNYAPNCLLLKQAQERINQRKAFNELFAIQNPTEDLNFADIEVDVIKFLFNPHHILKYEAAEKAAILAGDKLKNAHCIHFSCHGYFDFKEPLKSALILAKSESTSPLPSDDPNRYIRFKDKFQDLSKCLTIEDILHLNLSNCRIVTLSACETGITDATSISDEYISLSSGFILAGSPNVICSLWAVDELSTALLMIRFYQNLKQGETVTMALKNAQIWLREATKKVLLEWLSQLSSQFNLRFTYRLKLFQFFNQMEATSKPYASPYYWVGFCVIGAKE